MYLNEPSNYTIGDVHAVSAVIKTSANEQMQLTKLAESRKSTTRCDSELKELCVRHVCLWGT
jgi:hypothetical protein